MLRDRGCARSDRRARRPRCGLAKDRGTPQAFAAASFEAALRAMVDDPGILTFDWRPIARRVYPRRRKRGASKRRASRFAASTPSGRSESRSPSSTANPALTPKGAEPADGGRAEKRPRAGPEPRRYPKSRRNAAPIKRQATYKPESAPEAKHSQDRGAEWPWQAHLHERRLRCDGDRRFRTRHPPPKVTAP